MSDSLEKDRRHALQSRVSELESKIRRRLVGKLNSCGHGVYDLDDVMASARRRIDVAASKGVIRTDSRAALDAYIQRVAERVALEATRRERRSRERLRRLVNRRKPPNNIETSAMPLPDLHEILARLNADDRWHLELIARGLTHSETATSLGISKSAYKSRWRRLRHQLLVLLQAANESDAPAAAENSSFFILGDTASSSATS